MAHYRALRGCVRARRHSLAEIPTCPTGVFPFVICAIGETMLNTNQNATDNATTSAATSAADGCIKAAIRADRRMAYHLGVRLSERTRAELSDAATIERRTPSDLARLFIENALVARRCKSGGLGA